MPNKPTFENELINQPKPQKVVSVPVTGQIVPADPSLTMLGMIQQAAASPDVNVEKMESLWKMKQEIDAKEAETLFNLAMGIAQSQMTTIQNDCYNPQTKSRYASYKQLDKALRPIYTGNGFALSFNIEPTSIDDLISVLCYVTHNEGHSRTYSIQVPNDGKGPKGNPVMTKTHATGSASSYGMRYLLKMIFNVAVGEDDDDGNKATPAQPAPARLISEAQQNTIHAMLQENDLSVSIFLTFLDSINIDGIQNIPVADYKDIVKKLNDSIKNKAKKV